MTIGEYLGFNNDGLTHHTFDCKPAAIDLRLNPLNYDAASPVNLLLWHASQPPCRPIKSTPGTERISCRALTFYIIARFVAQDFNFWMSGSTSWYQVKGLPACRGSGFRTGLG